MGGFVDDVSIQTKDSNEGRLGANRWSFGNDWTVATSGSKATGAGAVQAAPVWVWYLAAGVAVLYALKRLKRGVK